MTFDDTIALVQETLRENGVAADLINKAVRDLRKAQEEEKADRAPTAKKGKLQHAILVSDPEGRLKGMDLVGWVVVIEEQAAPQMAYDRILTAAGAFNRSKRGRKAPLEKLGDAMEVLRGKWLKQDQADSKIAIKTRTPVAVQAVPNDLPKG